MAMRRSAVASFALVAGLLLLASSPFASSQSIASVAVANNLTLLVQGVQASGQATFLSNASLTITAFAPTDAAFQQLVTDLGITAADLLALGTSLAPIFSYHLLPTPVRAADVPTTATPVVTLLAGSNLTVVRNGGTVTVSSVGSDANVTVADVAATGSVVHVVNAVLLPFFKNIASAAIRTPSLSTLLAAVQAANLTSTLANPALNVTLFAPTNDAFTRTLAPLGLTVDALVARPALLADILRYHVVPQQIPASAATATAAAFPTLLTGKNVSVVAVNGGVQVTPIGGSAATVTAANLAVGVGPRSYIHLIDHVLLPFPTTIATAASQAGLSILLAAVQASNDTSLLAALNNATFPATVLAPTNAAFTSLLTSLGLTSAQLLADQANLNRILRAHIISGAVKSSALTDGQTVTTLGGAPLTVRISGGTVRFVAAKSNATVVAADVSVNADTSIVHVIDAVLIPADALNPAPSSPPPPPSGGSAGAAKPSAAVTAVAALVAGAWLYMAPAGRRSWF
ncbi:hypothetical protein HYH03_009547 [Edaphochlamys debaryana]|uniref:FAS1 domain-containing protein n=1 Tax=Edaphochlamys debaryana TaxID=47281 RepID=A0A835Y6S8_9CHLO|nr:hypothetical protein HYH03_009547 [Edaphochlamys debaryana]|eukprot:KAG2492049.1 hypothetical protein HYH03_009547 [Edaphochlamys debaryana]